MAIKSLVLNCTLKPSPERSNTEALAGEVLTALRNEGADGNMLRMADYDIKPGVTSDEGDGDQWPAIRAQILTSDILVIATPTWLGHPSSISQRVLERMDAMLSETEDDDIPVAYNKVAGVVVTGNEDGAHHVISEVAGGLIDIGFTVPAQAWTYWNKGPGPGPSYLETNEGRHWSVTTGRTMAKNLVEVARALKQSPMSAPKRLARP
jgi:multimeric flavodoxin WrbA